MNHWLLKSEPGVFSIADLAQRPDRTEHWDGVRNFQARNYMRTMKKGDLAFFYHSSCEVPGVAGVIEIARSAYPDFTSWDPKSEYYDVRSTPFGPVFPGSEIHATVVDNILTGNFIGKPAWSRIYDVLAIIEG